MSCLAQKQWTSFFTKEIEQIWHEEREEMKSISMLYCALQNEINRIQNVLSHEVSQIRSDIKHRDFLKKCRNFTGLAQSERFLDSIDVNKENETPPTDLNQELPLFSNPSIKSEESIIESPNTPALFNPLQSSPILKKNSLRKQSSVLLGTPSKFCKSPLKCTPNNSRPQSTLCDDSNILESTIIDDTPDVKSVKRNKFSLLQTRRRKKIKSSHNCTLTEMFLAPVKQKKISPDKSSMDITDILKFVNESSSETDAGILSDDATVAGLDAPVNNKSKPSLMSFAEKFDSCVICCNWYFDRSCRRLTFILHRAGRVQYIPDLLSNNKLAELENFIQVARERWSCRECEHYYNGLNLPPDELEKKKNECSRHRHNLKPKEETFDGFWDLTFGPSPRTPI